MVVAIIGAVLSVGFPAIQRVTYQRVNATTRKFVGLIREVRSDSVLLNRVHRIALDFDHRTFWVEGQKELRLIDETPPDQRKDKKQDPNTPSNFEFVEKYSKKPVPLADGVAFEGVLKEKEGFLKEGIAYLHFFPNGFNEQALLYLTREGSPGTGYSLFIRPTSGRVEILPGVVPTFDDAEKKLN